MNAAVIASTENELRMLMGAASAIEEASLGVRKTYSGRIGSRDVIFCVSGMGKINAASAATYLLERFSPRILISTGSAGAFPESGLTVGDLAAATSEIC